MNRWTVRLHDSPFFKANPDVFRLNWVCTFSNFIRPA